MARLILVCFTFAFGMVTAPLLWAVDSTSPMTRQEAWQAVAAELRQRGLSELELPRVESLDMPMALPALAGRRLRVSSICWDEGPRRVQFRLECGEPGECLPFLVYVHGRGNADSGERHGPCRLPSGPRLASVDSPGPSPQPTLRAGDRATAVFLADRLRMTAIVTCLERGREGQVIRVRGQEGHIFRARISGPARLEVVPQ